MQLNPQGRVIARLRVDRRGHAHDTIYQYSGEGDLLQVIDSERGVTRYEYDAARCGRHVEHVFDLYLNGDVAYPIAKAPAKLQALAKTKDGVDEALALAWQFAETGSYDTSLYDAVREYIGDYPPDADDNYEEVSGGAWVCWACRHLLEAFKDPTPESTSAATDCCIDALADGLNCIDAIADSPQQDPTAIYYEPEINWQVKVLDRVAASAAPTRAQLADLLKIELPWRSLLPEYRLNMQGK